MSTDVNNRVHAPEGVTNGGQYMAERTPEPVVPLLRAPTIESEPVEVRATGPGSLTSIIEATGPDFWIKMAEHRDTPMPVLAELSRNENANIRMAVASNFALDEPIRDALSRDEKGDVRASLIYSFDGSTEFLRRFEGDEEYAVNEELARPRTSTMSSFADCTRRKASLFSIPTAGRTY
jgi:hypothetical protein